MCVCVCVCDRTFHCPISELGGIGAWDSDIQVRNALWIGIKTLSDFKKKRKKMKKNETKKSDIVVRSQILRGKTRGKGWDANKVNKKPEKEDSRSVREAVRLLWRAAAPGLKPLRLPRA